MDVSFWRLGPVLEKGAPGAPKYVNSREITIRQRKQMGWFDGKGERGGAKTVLVPVKVTSCTGSK
jgi:hypothetical protein